MKRAAWLLLVALGTIGLALLAWYMSSVLVLLVAAIFLGATMRPMSLHLQRIGVPGSISVLLMALVIFVGVLFLIGVVGYSIGDEAPKLVRELQGKWLAVRTDWSEGAPWQQSLAENMGDPLSLDTMVAALDSLTAPSGVVSEQTATPLIQELTATNGAAQTQSGTEESPAAVDSTAPPSRTDNAIALLRVTIEAAGGVAALLGQLIILVFVSIYWTMEHEWFERLWTSLLPAHVRQPARVTWLSIEANVGIHVRSEIVQSLLAFTLSWTLFYFLGINQPLLLATVVALAWYIPLVGWLIALAVILPIAVLNPFWVTITATVGLLAIFALLEFVIEPRLDKARNKLEIVGLIFAMIFLEFFGLIGLLLASPVAVALAAGTRTWTAENSEQRQVVKENAFETLRARVEVLRSAVNESGEELPQRTLSLYKRLETLLAEAEPSLRRRVTTKGITQNGENVTRQLP